MSNLKERLKERIELSAESGCGDMPCCIDEMEAAIKEIERLEAKAERSRVILDIAYERCMKAEDRVAELEAEVKALWLEKIERTNVASRYAIDTTPDSEGENNE